MRKTIRFRGILALLLLILSPMLWAIGCSESTSPTDGTDGDTDPPTITGITAIDAFHIEVTFNEALDEPTAERTQNYAVVEKEGSRALSSRPPTLGDPSEGAAAPGDTIYIESAVLKQDQETVALTTEIDMHAVNYDLFVSGVKDANGNRMTTTQTMEFSGNEGADQTPPEIVYRSPSPGETGIGLSQSVEVQFSEGMQWNTVYTAFSWTGGGGTVEFTMNQADNNLFVFTPLEMLAVDETYTVGFAANTAKDWADNSLAPVSWVFRTILTMDTTPPTIVSTTPRDGATNVSLNANLAITFSEPIDPNSLEQGGILMTPNPGDGIPSWSNGNRKFTFDPDDPLLPNTAYVILILPGALEDYAGNPLAEGASIQFSTGSSMPAGSFSGTVAGDPQSLEAADPEGTIVAALTSGLDGDDGPPPIGGSDIADASGDYEISNLADDVYYPLGVLDSNGDGIVGMEMGDAMGVYGIDVHQGDWTPDSVTITGGSSVFNINFPLYDPVAVAGAVSYDGTRYSDSLAYFLYYIGIWDTVAFDTSQGIPAPDYSTYGDFIATEPEYALSEFDDGLAPGVYYVGGFLDVNFNYNYDPDVDPVGMYMLGAEFTPVVLENGRDELDINIIFEDPAGGASPTRSTWHRAGRKPGASTPLADRMPDWLRSRLKQALANMRAR